MGSAGAGARDADDIDLENCFLFLSRFVLLFRSFVIIIALNVMFN